VFDVVLDVAVSLLFDEESTEGVDGGVSNNLFSLSCFDGFSLDFDSSIKKFSQY
jgi:hypothetical protein